MPLDTTEERVTRWLDENAPGLTELLERLINTDSFSTDKADVDAVGGIIRDYLESHRIGIEVHGDGTYGDALIARVGSGAKPVLLMGHRDTVFPKGEAQRRRFKVVAGRAYGPGVNDMKAGVAINAFLLAAFQNCFEEPPALMGLPFFSPADRIVRAKRPRRLQFRACTRKRQCRHRSQGRALHAYRSVR